MGTITNRKMGVKQNYKWIYGTSFNDVPSGKWYESDVLIARQAGYSEGFAGLEEGKGTKDRIEQRSSVALRRIFLHLSEINLWM
nr:hypothetical protein [Paenibacillus sp.]